jgi:preprotein translocase subunit SecA
MHTLPTFPAPGIVLGDYPERREHGSPANVGVNRASPIDLITGRRASLYAGFAARVDKLHDELFELQPQARAAMLPALRAGLTHAQAREGSLSEALALASIECELRLGLRPYRAQIIAARVMLDGRLAEMATGEGKTVAIALAAAAAALGGAPVHVVTANDYLAGRDAAYLAPLFAALGLRVAAVTQEMKRDARRAAYAADVAYCTAKELAFDYLRDGLARSPQSGNLVQRARRLARADDSSAQPVLRGLCVAIVDEADTVLIDEARVPLVISRRRERGDSSGFLADMLLFASSLRESVEFQLQQERQAAVLTAAGLERLDAWPRLPGAQAEAGNQRHRIDCACLAVAALHVFRRDRDYVLGADGVTIVDETTGRVAAGRSWSRGLHQLIELKEGIAPSERNETIAQITFQRFFRRYLHLAGMSGTLRECAAELRRTYGTPVVGIPSRARSRRLRWPSRLFRTNDELFEAVVASAAQVARSGRPVLIGMSSVTESEQLSSSLTALGLPHALLNARQDREEAAIVARAGERARITVATSMAGRGTDIALAPGVAELGGLHVILCQHNPSRRIDRQFVGRAARRGEPGSYAVMLSLESPLFSRLVPPGRRAWLGRLGTRFEMFLRLASVIPQWLEEREHARQRFRLARADTNAERALAFSGKTAT